MTIRFEGQVIILTGACGSLGRAFAHAYFERGANLILSDLGASMAGDADNTSAVEDFAKALDPSGRRVLFDNSDISDVYTGETLVQKALTTFGRVDVLVHGAGNMRNGSFKRMNAEDFKNVLDIHLLGTAYLSRAAFPHMLDQGYGRILMITSAGGLYGAFGVANYGAAKTGLLGLMNVLNIESGDRNVLTNALAPIADSRMLTGLFAEETGDATAPQWVVPPALYLTSKECRQSGEIIVSAGRHYAKAQIVESKGVNAPETGGYPEPEFIAQNFDDITNMKDAAPMGSLGDAMRKAFDKKVAI